MGRALHGVVEHDHGDQARALVEVYKVKLNGRECSGKTALHYAAYIGNERLVKLLLGRGARVDVRGSASPTALDWAGFGERKGTAMLLVGKGAKIYRSQSEVLKMLRLGERYRSKHDIK